MSDVMLLGVLRMPPEIWGTHALDVRQRHGRYLQAADTIEELRDEVARLNHMLEEHYVAKPFVNTLEKLLEDAHVENEALRKAMRSVLDESDSSTSNGNALAAIVRIVRGAIAAEVPRADA